jgi:hypothetical protein
MDNAETVLWARIVSIEYQLQVASWGILFGLTLSTLFFRLAGRSTIGALGNRMSKLAIVGDKK